MATSKIGKPGPGGSDPIPPELQVAPDLVYLYPPFDLHPNSAHLVLANRYDAAGDVLFRIRVRQTADVVVSVRPKEGVLRRGEKRQLQVTLDPIKDRKVLGQIPAGSHNFKVIVFTLAAGDTLAGAKWWEEDRWRRLRGERMVPFKLMSRFQERTGDLAAFDKPKKREAKEKASDFQKNNPVENPRQSKLAGKDNVSYPMSLENFVKAAVERDLARDAWINRLQLENFLKAEAYDCPDNYQEDDSFAQGGQRRHEERGYLEDEEEEEWCIEDGKGPPLKLSPLSLDEKLDLMSLLDPEKEDPPNKSFFPAPAADAGWDVGQEVEDRFLLGAEAGEEDAASQGTRKGEEERKEGEGPASSAAPFDPVRHKATDESCKPLSVLARELLKMVPAVPTPQRCLAVEQGLLLSASLRGAESAGQTARLGLVEREAVRDLFDEHLGAACLDPVPLRKVSLELERVLEAEAARRRRRWLRAL